MGVLFVKSANLRVISILVFCLMSQIGFAQKTISPINPCPNLTGGEGAHFAVMYFLKYPIAENARIETGATNESVDQIKQVSDETICSALNQIVLNTPKYKRVDDNLDTKNTKYYYRTDNFYYIFWDRKPEHDNKITGPKSLFIVVSSNYEHVWEYYF
jgi:hypothetical protein